VNKAGGFARITLIAVLALMTTAAAIVESTGCASLGLAPAQSFDQGLAYAYGTHTAIEQTAAAAASSGAISQAEAASVLKLGDQSRQLLDSARTVEAAGNAAGASQDLALATAILTQLQSYLQARGIK
jgi:hypothetical protein